MGTLSPAPNAKVHPSVKKFETSLSSPGMSFMDLVRPRHIELDYYSYGPIQPYKPSGSENPQLRHIVLRVSPLHDPPLPLFDFSGVPQAEILAEFYIGANNKMHIPEGWKTLKRQLPTLFHKDLNGFNVCRSDRHGARIFRPSQETIQAGWVPEDAVHLQGPEYDEREAEDMRLYYEMRARQRRW